MGNKGGRVDTKQIFDEIVAKRERFRDEKRVGSVGYDEQTETIDFYFGEQSEQVRYWIYFRELQTAEGQMRWLFHLRTKGWLTITVLNDLLDCLEYLGLKTTFDYQARESGTQNKTAHQ